MNEAPKTAEEACERSVNETPDFLIDSTEQFICRCGALKFTPNPDQPPWASITVWCSHCGSAVEVVPALPVEEQKPVNPLDSGE